MEKKVKFEGMVTGKMRILEVVEEDENIELPVKTLMAGKVRRRE